MKIWVSSSCYTVNAGDCTRVSGISPFPEKFFTKTPARKIAVTDPRKVVTVAQVMAYL